MKRKYTHNQWGCGGNVSYFKAGKYYHLFRCDKCKKLIIGNPIKNRKPDKLKGEK